MNKGLIALDDAVTDLNAKSLSFDDIKHPAAAAFFHPKFLPQQEPTDQPVMSADTKMVMVREGRG